MIERMEKVIIIGGGPAGLTAAIYAARANLEPVVFAGAMYGGQLMLTTEVENFPGFPQGIMGPDLMQAFREQAERFGAKIHNEDVARVDLGGVPARVWAGDAEYRTQTLIVATGRVARPATARSSATSTSSSSAVAIAPWKKRSS